MAVITVFQLVRILILLTVSVQLIGSHHVPVFIWGPENHVLSSMSSLSYVTNDQFKKDYLKHLITPNQKVVIFVQDRFSMEDISVHGNGLTPQGQNYNHLQALLDENPSFVLPSVEDPFQALRELKGQKSIQTLDYNDDVRHKLSGSRSDITLVYLPSTVGLDNRPEALKANDELMSKAVSHFGNKNYLAIFTGKEPSWDAASEEAAHRRISRSLLATAEENSTTTNFAIYVDSFKVKILDTNGVYNVTNETLAWPPTIKLENQNGSLQMNWKFATKGTVFSDFSMELLFVKAATYWKTTDMKAQFTKDSNTLNYNLTANREITAGTGFSFSCSNTILSGKWNSTSLYLTLHNFQVEPFARFNLSNATFSDSYHCSTFFTLPIWMGFFTLLLFTAILGLGLLMLFEVKTTDRFDDPKGKTITVPQSE